MTPPTLSLPCLDYFVRSPNKVKPGTVSCSHKPSDELEEALLVVACNLASKHSPSVAQAALNAAGCLRVLALSDGLPEKMASASAIPALVDGLKSRSALMKSVCGGEQYSIDCCFSGVLGPRACDCC